MQTGASLRGMNRSMRLVLFCIFLVNVVGIHSPGQQDCTLFSLPGSCEKSVCLEFVGSPFKHVWRTQDGYSLCKKSDEDRFVFMEGQGVCSTRELRCNQETALPGTKPGLWHQDKEGIPREVLLSRNGTYNSNDKIGKTLHNLVLLVRWKDHINDSNLHSREAFDILFNKEGGDPELAPTGSVSDVFKSNLNDQIRITTTVFDWVDSEYTEREAASGVGSNGLCQGTCSAARVRDAIYRALTVLVQERGVNLADFDRDGDKNIDMFTVIHSGYGAESGGLLAEHRIWSHKFVLDRSFSNNGVRVREYNINPGYFGRVGTSITRIGVIAHECFHFLGLPDLYDTDGSSAGIGYYGLMGYSWGRNNDQLYPGSLSAWSKYQLGVLNVITVTDPGTLSLAPVQQTGVALKFKFSYAGSTKKDFLLIENRASTGFDELLDGGLLVWHIDPSIKTNNEESDHYKVRLIQQDGKKDLENFANRGDSGDWFQSGSNPLHDLSIPSLNSYSLNASGICSGHFLEQFSKTSTGTFIFSYSQKSPNCSGIPGPPPTPSPTLTPSNPGFVATLLASPAGKGLLATFVSGVVIFGGIYFCTWKKQKDQEVVMHRHLRGKAVLKEPVPSFRV